MHVVRFAWRRQRLGGFLGFRYRDLNTSQPYLFTDLYQQVIGRSHTEIRFLRAQVGLWSWAHLFLRVLVVLRV